MRDAILIIATVVLSFLALRRPIVGMFGFIGYGLLAPHTLAWGLARTIPHSMILALCTILGYFFSRDRKAFPVERETVLIFGLWCWFGLSTVFAIESKAALLQLILMSKILLMVILSTVLVRSEEELHTLFRVIGLALGFYALKGGLWFIRTGGGGMVEAPEGSFLSANNSLGVALVMNVPILYFLARAEERVWLRRLFHGLFWLSYLAILGTYSRGAWLGLAAVTGLIFLKVRYKVLLITLGVGMFIVISPWVSGLVSDRLQQRAETLTNMQQENSTQQRLDSWTYCFRVGANNPVFGGGFDFHSRSTIQKYYPEILDRWEGKVWSCHSSWLTVWSEHGMLGFLLFILLLLSVFASLRRIRNRLRQNPGLSTLRHWLPMLQFSLVGYLVSATFVDFAYFDLLYQLIAGVTVLTILVDRRLTLEDGRVLRGDADQSEEAVGGSVAPAQT